MRTSASSRPLVVGFDQYTYGGAYNIYAPIEGVTHRKVQRLPIDRLFSGTAPNWALWSYVPASLTRVDVLHTLNRVNWGPRKWGTTFASEFPRFFLPREHWLMKAALRRLTSERCRFVIGMSRWAVALFRSRLTTEELGLVEGKLHQLYPAPPFSRRETEYQPPSEREQLRLVFVGTDFFGKGGEGVLDALDELGEELDVTCEVIGRVSAGDMGTRLVDEHVMELTRKRLTDSPRIRWRESVPHDEIGRLLERAHIGVLPTLNDIFGYAVLEYLVMGLPTFTSNVNVIPEIVDDEVGWRAELPKDGDGYWLGWKMAPSPRRSDLYKEASERIRERLIDALRSARDDPESLSRLSKAALERATTRFGATARATRLRAIYETAVAQ